MLSGSTVTTLTLNIPAAAAQQGIEAVLYDSKTNEYLDSSQTYVSVPTTGSGMVPYITLLAPSTSTSTSAAPTSVQLAIPYEGQDMNGGELIIYVGPVNTGVTYKGGAISAPSLPLVPNVTTTTKADNFAQFEFTYTETAGLDVDSTTVDTSGYPFTIVSPSSANVAYPLSAVGITLSQSDVLTNFNAAISSDESASAFAQCATYVQQQDSSALELVAPKDILSNDTTTPVCQPTLTTGSGSLPGNCYYYYVITAYSDTGETLPCNYVNSPWVGADASVQLTWSKYYDPNVVGYNIYRTGQTSTTTPPTSYTLIGSVAAGTSTTLTFNDDGTETPPTTPKTIDTTTAKSYGFNPLSSYYTSELESFFDNYNDNYGKKTFSIQYNGNVWSGNTISYTPTGSWNTTHAAYTVLQLTAQTPNNGVNNGDVINIYEPFFSMNTIGVVTEGAPVMPSWIGAKAGTVPAVSPSQYESPGQMVLGCDGVFASKSNDPDVAGSTADQAALGAIENCIVSAFNRGIATNYNIVPDNWAAFPQLQSAPVVGWAAPGATTTPYYYAVSAVTQLPSNQYSETTTSLEVSAALAPGQTATLTWTYGGALPATSYNVYGGTSPDSLTLIGTTDQTTYPVAGCTPISSQTPMQYFAAGSTSNWYAAFLATNSSLTPTTGASLSGLSYGFAYSDQGNLSTNIQYAADNTPTNITLNFGAQTGPSFVTQSLPDAVVGTGYSQTFVVSGSGTGTTYAIIGTLPSGITLNANTLSGTASVAGVYTFDVQATNSEGTNAMPFTLTVDPSGMAAVDVSVSPSAVANDDTSSMTYTFARTGSTSGALTVSFTVSGTATYQTNYTESGATTFLPTSGTVTIADGTSSATVIITPTGTSIDQDETVTLTVTAGTDYAVGSPSEATGTILSNIQDSTIGLYNSAAGMFYLRDTNTSGVADNAFPYGPGGSNLIPITGDWTNSGITTIGLYSQATGTVYLRNESSSGVADTTFQFGPAGNNLIPFAGNWTDSGITTIGLYSQATGTVYLRNENSSGVADTTFQFGPAGNSLLPIAGDWTASGITTIGLYSQATGTVYLLNENSSRVADITFQFGPAGNSLLPIAGDWTASGYSTLGLYSQATGTVYLLNENSSGVADITFQYGSSGNRCTPIAGHWSDASSTLTTTSNVTGFAETTALTQTELDPITNEAIKRWQASGITADATAKLEAAKIEIANLSGPKLAVIENGVIYLDRTAAGYGWFVDSAPSSDEEYTATATGVAMRAKSSTEAVDHIDLLTVVEQELGKVAGLGDLTDCVVDNQIGVSSRSSLLAAG